MTLATGRRLPSDRPELVGRAPEDYAEELQAFLEHSLDQAYGGLPAGFNEVDPTTVDGAAVADPGLESDGWASASHQHPADVSGTPGNVTAAASVQGAGPGFSLSTHTHGIDDAAVTYAKIQDVTAASRLLGRGSAAGAGDVQELTLGAGLSMTGTVLSAAPVAPVVLRPAQVTSNQNDYSPGTIDPNHTTVFVSTDASRDFSGVSATGAVDGTTLLWINNGSFNEVLQHENAGSAAANRLTCPGAGNLTLLTNGCVRLVRDATTARWRVFEL